LRLRSEPASSCRRESTRQDVSRSGAWTCDVFETCRRTDHSGATHRRDRHSRPGSHAPPIVHGQPSAPIAHPSEGRTHKSLTHTAPGSQAPPSVQAHPGEPMAHPVSSLAVSSPAVSPKGGSGLISSSKPAPLPDDDSHTGTGGRRHPWVESSTRMQPWSTRPMVIHETIRPSTKRRYHGRSAVAYGVWEAFYAGRVARAGNDPDDWQG